MLKKKLKKKAWKDNIKSTVSNDERFNAKEEPIELDPMPPNERKIIHQSLSRNSRIATESRGKGNRRRITIFPAD